MHLAIICDALQAQDPIVPEAVALASHLADHGHRINLLCGHHVDIDLDARIELHQPKRLPRLPVFKLIAFRRWLRKTLHTLDVDCRVSFSSCLSAELVVPMCGTTRALTHARSHAGTTFSQRIARVFAACAPAVWVQRLFERRMYANPALKAVIAVSPRIAVQLDAFNLPGVVEVRRVALPLPEHAVQAEQAATLRARLARGLGLDADRAWVVFPFQPGHLGGVEPMISAFKALVDGGTDAVLLFAGRARYTHLAWIAQLGLRERVRFVGGSDRKTELIAACDVVAHPTTYDPGGWDLQPALAARRPIITTPASDAAEHARALGGTVLDSSIDAGQLLAALRDHISRGRDAQSPVAQTAEVKQAQQDDPENPPRPLAHAIEAVLRDINPPGAA